MSVDPRDPVRLRGHHLGCVQGFQGYGYDGPFTDRMTVLAATLRGDPTHPVRVAAADDDVCGPCPHREGDRCVRTPAAQRAVDAHDRAFLAALGLAPGQATSVAAVNARIDADPAVRAALRSACRRCPWTDRCTFFQRL